METRTPPIYKSQAQFRIIDLIESVPMKRRAFEVAAVCFALTVCFLASGCRSKKIDGLVPVEGIVLYDGIPLAWASMTFAPVKSSESKDAPRERGAVRVATAQTDENGRFVVNTLGLKGALPGEYAITVEKYVANEDDAVVKWEKRRAESGYKEPKPEEDVFNAVSALPLRYSEKKNSGLKAEIPEKGTKDLKVELVKE